MVAAAGWVLIVAALAKALAVSRPAWFECLVPMAAETWGAVLVTEFAIGAALVAWRRSAIAWSLGVAFFLLVGSLASWIAWESYGSCRCFGPVDMRPAWMAGVDFAILGILVSRTPENRVLALRYIMVAAVLIVAFAGPLWLLLAGIHYWKSADRDFDIQPVVRLGEVAESSRHEFSIAIENHGDSPLTIQGAGGPNVRFSSVPVTIAPHSSDSLKAWFSTGTRHGGFCNAIDFWMEYAGKLRPASIRLTGRIVPVSTGARSKPSPRYGTIRKKGSTR